MLAGTVYSRWRLITRVDEWTTLRNYIEFSIITRVECVGFELSMTCIAIGNFRAACIMSNAKKSEKDLWENEDMHGHGRRAKAFFSLDLGATVVVGRLAGTYDLRHSIAILYFASVRGNAV